MHKARRGFNVCWVRGINLQLCLASGFALVLAFVCAPRSHSQTGSGQNGGQGSIHGTFSGRVDMGPLAGDDYDPVMMERRLRALNMERQKEMVSDTNKLLKLARELNAEAVGQKSETLTPDQLHKIAEIEKLARNVKERMASGVGQPQTVIPPPTVVYPVH